MKNGRDPILQAEGEIYAGKPEIRTRTLLPDSILALQEAYYQKGEDDSSAKTTSNVFIMASLLGENTRSFGATGDETQDSRNEDENILFYVNMVMKDCENPAKILQLGGWTERTSFKDAYSSNTDDQDKNILKTRLEAYDIEVEENFVMADETTPFPQSDSSTGTEVTTLWIANPLGKPEQYEIDRMKRFLELGNKKIVITYAGNHISNTQLISENVDYICNALNLESRPVLRPDLRLHRLSLSLQHQYQFLQTFLLKPALGKGVSHPESLHLSC